MRFYHSCSFGKDSLATLILDYIHELPPSTILFTEVMFDLKRNISGELPEHMDFIHKRAIPLLKSWGYEVKILRADKDYLGLFYHVLKKSSHPERIGKCSGWLIGGKCAANRSLKVEPIKKYLKQFSPHEITQYVGIAANETKRLERLQGTNKVSLLERYGYTEKMAFDLCKEYDLLSPVYDFAKRGGNCWFCPNGSYAEFAHTKKYHPELWEELKKLSYEKNRVSDNFKWGESFSVVEEKVDRLIYDG